MDSNNHNAERILHEAETVVWHETFIDLVECLRITRRALSTVGDLVLGDVEPWPVRRMRIMAHIEAALDSTDGYDFQTDNEVEE